MPGRLGFPAISTPNAPADRAALRLWQQAIDNIRERFRTIEAAVLALQSTTEALQSGTGLTARITRLARDLELLTLDVEAFIALFDLDAQPADGDVLTWVEEQNQFVPLPPAATAGGVLPVVTGEVPPVLVYLDDGSLVYLPVEA